MGEGDDISSSEEQRRAQGSEEGPREGRPPIDPVGGLVGASLGEMAGEDFGSVTKDALGNVPDGALDGALGGVAQSALGSDAEFEAKRSGRKVWLEALGEGERLMICNAMATNEETVRVSFSLASGASYWTVSHVSLSEALSEPYHATASLTTSELGSDASELLGERVTIELSRGSLMRRVHGVIDEVTTGDEATANGHNRSCAVRIVPAVALFADCRDSRVFQGKTVPEIIEAVLAPLSDYDATFEVQKSRTYPVCEYRTQYGESDLDFVHRLMGEEGLFYFFDHEGNTEHLVIGDSESVYGAIESTDGNLLTFANAEGANIAEGVTSFARREATRPSKLTLRHFDWTCPDVPLEGASTKPTPSAPLGARVGPMREVYEHDAHPLTIHSYDTRSLGYQADDHADQLKLRRQMHEQTAASFSGGGTAIGTAPSRTFWLTGHPNGALDADYVIVSAHHDIHVDDTVGDTSGFATSRAATYSNHFVAASAALPYRAMRRGKPRVPGILTATVVGPSGQEVHTDEHGRVKVQFHWDRLGRRDELSSCYIRVMQAWAGAGWGSWFLPRIGMEAVVSFIHGDPDRPVVTGTLYNSIQHPPFPLPTESTRSGIRTNSSPTTGGFNELRFEDSAGAEEVFLRAQKDLNEVVKHDHTTQVIGNQANIVIGQHSVSVGMDRRLTVTMDETVAIGGARTETVTGAETIRLLDSRDTDITKSDKLVVHETRDEDIEGAFTGRYLGGRTVTVENGDTETVVDSDKTVTVDGVYEVEVGTHFRVKRAGTEIFVEDVICAESPTKVELIVGGNSIAIESDGKMTMTATAQIELVCGSASLLLKSDGTIQASGSTKVELASGSSVVTVEVAKIASASAQIDLDGSSMVNVKGGMINLN
jgi:type VI secretion system secreted protein VgrG